MKFGYLVLPALVALVTAFASPVQAAVHTFGFSRVSFNSEYNVYDQLRFTYDDAEEAPNDPYSVILRFYNDSLTAPNTPSSIIGVYLDDDAGGLVSGLGINNFASPGVTFVTPAEDVNSDGPNNIVDAWRVNFGPVAKSAGVANPPSNIAKGVDSATEFLEMELTLNGLKSEFLTAIENGSLRIGLNVAGFLDDPLPNPPYLVDSYLNSRDEGPVAATAQIPEPATLAIWGLGLGIAGLVRLRRQKSAA